MLRAKYTKRQQDKLWERFSAGDMSARGDLLESYLDTVDIVARKTFATLPGYVELDDLIQEGCIGLMDALDRYVDTGNKFETYASVRIRFQIYDYLRDVDPISRHFRSEFKKLMKVIDLLWDHNDGAEPSDEEVAEAIEWPIERVSEMRFALWASSSSISLDDETIPESVLESSVFEVDPEEADLAAIVAECLNSLPGIQSEVVMMSNCQGLPYVEIAKHFGVHQSRITQIYGQAMQSVRDALRDYL